MYTEPAFSMEGVENWLQEWGPRILAAAAILIVAYLVGKAVKWALAKGIDRIPGAHHANQGADKKSTIGARLGDVGYWLVLLFGIVLALNQLRLTGVVEPLNAMLTDFVQFIPRLVGAAVWFFVGFIVATIAKRLVIAALEAANLDQWLQKAGLAKVTGASGLAKTIGTIVFVLILIPVSIQALQTLNVQAISQPAVAVLSTILDAIPRIIVAAVILAFGFFIARFAASLVQQLLQSFGFDNQISSLTNMGGESNTTVISSSTPGASTPSPAAGASPSKIVGQVVATAIMIFFAVEATRQLQFAEISEVLEQILDLGGAVIFGGVIIAAGVIIANFLSKMLDRSTGGADGFASVIVKWATIALSVAIGLRFMGLANDIITLAFGLILGSAAVAAALAFGIGGREQAGQWLQRWSQQAQQKQAQMEAEKRAQQAAQASTPSQPSYTPPSYTPPPGE
jgi:hypothetical protein